MKKVLFIAFLPLEKGNGISNKIMSQVQAFNNNGCATHLLHYRIKDGSYSLYIDDREFYRLGSFSRHFKGKMYEAISKYIVREHYDLVYYRSNNFTTGNVINLFKSIRGRCNILFEIPTYPYDSEYNSGAFSMRIVNFIDRFYRKKLIGCIDKIITFVNEDAIFGVPTITISNGVDINRLPIVKNNRISGNLNLIAVANIDFWHGLDRLIEGFRLYYSDSNKLKKVNVSLKIIGNGNQSVKENLQKLVEKYSLNEWIKFYGNTSGDKLTDLFNVSDIAIGCLACHRKNIVTVKSLKNVEYAVRGIPFMYSEINDDFDNQPYVLKIDPTDNPIDVKKIIKFYNEIRVSPDDIRKTALHLTWDNQIRKILNSL